MSLREMAEAFPDMCVTIRLGDLMEANEALVRKVREEVEAETMERERVCGCKLIPKAEVKAMLDVCDTTLWRWENEYDYLKPVRFGGKTFYREPDINAIIEAHTDGGEKNHKRIKS